MLLLGQCLESLVVGVVLHLPSRLILRHIGHIDHRLQGQKRHIREGSLLLLGQVGTAGGLPVRQHRQHLLKGGHLGGDGLVPVAQQLLEGGQALLHQLHIRQDQLHVDGLHIPHRIHTALHMDDVPILEATDDVQHSVHLPDVGKELVPQTLSLGGTPDKAGNVHEFNDSRRILLRMVHLGQLVQPLIGYGHHAYIGFYGAEGVIGGLCAAAGQGIKKGRLAHIGQSYDSEFHTVSPGCFFFDCTAVPSLASRTVQSMIIPLIINHFLPLCKGFFRIFG